MAKKRPKKRRHEEKDPLVGIAGVICGIYLVIVVLFLVMAEQWAGLLIPIGGIMCLLGIFLGYFAYKR